MKNTIPLKTINFADFNNCEGAVPLFNQLGSFGLESLTLPKKLSAVSDNDVTGGILFWSRANRRSHPSGSMDKGGRWYPSDEEDPLGKISSSYRSPSRAWPWSYMTACRTAEHCAELAGADVSAVRKVKNFVEKTLASLSDSAEQERGEIAGGSQAICAKNGLADSEQKIVVA